MTRHKYLGLWIAVYVLMMGSPIYADDFADKLLKQMDQALFPENFVAKFQMRNYKDNQAEQTFEMEVYNKKDFGTLTVFIAPASEKGKKMLFVSNTIWFYVPGASRAVALSARQPFMGSAFANSDLMDSTMNDDYDAKLLEDEIIDGTECYQLELSAKHDKVTYKKVILWVRKDHIVPIKIEYFTLSGKLFKRMTLSELKKIEMRVRPTLLKMENLLETQTYTEVQVLGIHEKNDLNDVLFTQSHLTK